MKDEKGGLVTMGKSAVTPPFAPFASSLSFDAVLPHAPARVFCALTRPAAISAWLLPVEAASEDGEDATTDEPRVGTRWTLQAPPSGGWDGRIACEITEATTPPPGASGEPWRLSYTWRTLTEDGSATTLVSWTLTPCDGNRATRLHLTHGPVSGPVAFALFNDGAAHAGLALTHFLRGAASFRRRSIRGHRQAARRTAARPFGGPLTPNNGGTRKRIATIHLPCEPAHRV